MLTGCITDSLERQLLERQEISLDEAQNRNQQKVAGSHHSSGETPAITALSLETQRLSTSITELSQTIAFLAESASGRMLSSSDPEKRSTKRQKIDDTPGVVQGDAENTPADILRSEEEVDDLLETYFSNLHSWIPMIHKSTFRDNVRTKSGKHKNELVLHAIWIGASRYDNQQKSPTTMTPKQVQQAYDHVLLMANQSLEVRNLQALVILAFRHVCKIPAVSLGQNWILIVRQQLGDGELTKAWPIIASLTRTAELLGICDERPEAEARPESFFSPPLQSAPLSWAEKEEHRRVFWNIFILDRSVFPGGLAFFLEVLLTMLRICSITTG